MLPALLLVVILLVLIGTLKAEKNVLPLQIGLVVLGLICSLWYLKTRPKPLDAVEMEADRQQAVGYVLCKEALKELGPGDEILLLTTSLPVWKYNSESMQKGVKIALEERKDITLRSLDITTLPDGNRVDVDGALMLKAAAPEMQGSDAVLTAFPAMGQWTTSLPKLPPTYVYYAGNSDNWKTLIKRKRLKAVALGMFWREDPPTEELHPLEELFRREYVLANAENVAEFR